MELEAGGARKGTFGDAVHQRLAQLLKWELGGSYS